MTRSDILAFMENRKIVPKFGHYMKATEYACVKESWIPTFLKLLIPVLRKQGLLTTTNKKAVCRQRVLCALNFLSQLWLEDKKADEDESPLAVDFNYIPDDASFGIGHNVIQFIVRGKDGKPKPVYLCVVKLKIITLTENEEYQTQWWGILT